MEITSNKVNIFLIFILILVLIVEIRRASIYESFWGKKKKKKKSGGWDPFGIRRRREREREKKRQAEAAELARQAQVAASKAALAAKSKSKTAALAQKAYNSALDAYKKEQNKLIEAKRKNVLKQFRNKAQSVKDLYKKTQKGMASEIRKAGENYQYLTDEFGKLKDFNDKYVYDYLKKEYNDSKASAYSIYEKYKGDGQDRGVVGKSKDESEAEKQRIIKNNNKINEIA